MNLSVIKLPHQQPQFFAHCPNSGHRVAVQDLRAFELISQQVTWWRCTDCGGWHVTLKHNEAEKVEGEEAVGVTYTEIRMRTEVFHSQDQGQI